MKTGLVKKYGQLRTRPASQGQSRQQAKATESGFSNVIDNSPAMTLQRRQLEASFGTSIQRVEPEEEELMQGKFKTLQRQAEEEEEPLQGKFSEPLQREQEIASAPNKTGMPDNLKSGIESLSGMDMSDVRVHYNSSRPAQLNALAYAQGNDIHLGAGQDRHLPHEAWHMVQQRQGRVQPTMQMEGQQINDDVGLEREADVMGSKALQYKSKEE